MNWIAELDKYGHNFLIDELVWHIEQGRFPLSINIINSVETSGYEFIFTGSKAMILKVEPNILQEHWDEAKEIAGQFNQLESIRFVHS